MKNKDLKKKILPIMIVLLLTISLISSIAMSVGINRWPTTYDSTGAKQNGTWNISEHVRDGTIDYSWNVSYNNTGGTPWMVNDTVWNLDEFSDYTFNYSIMWNNSTGSAGDNPFHYALANYSYMNRSQSLVFTRVQNWSWDTETYAGVIFSANNLSGTNGGIVDNFTCVLYGPKSCYVLNYSNYTGKLYDVKNGTEITNNASAGLTNYYHNWLTDQYYYDYYDQGMYNGTWIKTIYNTHCGYLQSKYWGNSSSLVPDGMLGFLNEPTGWVIDSYLPNISTNDSVMCGLAVWNPNGGNTLVQFDMYDVWRMNYSLNGTYNITGEKDNYARPHMNFSLMNSSLMNSTLVDLWFDAVTGNITMDNITDLWIHLTNKMGYESRPYHFNLTAGDPNNLEGTLQNDTIHYYSTVITNFNEFADYWFDANPFTGNPDEVLWLYIQDSPQGWASDAVGETGLFISIDTDNNGEWDVHDRAFYTDSSGLESSWTGNALDAATNFVGDNYCARGLQSLHKYNWSNYHWVMIPISEFPKLNNNSGDYLNQGDTFGLNIFTFNTPADDNVPVWQNYNETTCNVFVNENNSDGSTKKWFINNSAIEVDGDLVINDTCVGRWGEGRIGKDARQPFDFNFNLSVMKTANVTLINTGLNTTTPHLVNYSINVTNDGSGNLTDIQINETWMNCSCSNWNYTIIAWYNNSNSSSESLWNLTGNITWNNDSCYVIINISNLSQNEYFNLTFTVDIRPCSNDTRGIITNYANVTCGQTGVTGSNTHKIRWAQTSQLHITATRSITDVMEIANSVTTIIGIILIIAAIMAIVGIVYTRFY